MPPFALPNSATDSNPSPPPSITSTTGGFASLLKSFGRVTAKSSATTSDSLVSSTSTSSHDDPAKKEVRRAGVTGSSSRAAGVRPAKGASTSGLSPPTRRDDFSHDLDLRGVIPAGNRTESTKYVAAGPSRGGFVAPHADLKPLPKTVVPSPIRSTKEAPPSPSPLVVALPPVQTPASVPASLAVKRSLFDPNSTIPPPSTIIVTLHEMDLKEDYSSVDFVQQIKLLAKSVSIYLYPPPAIAVVSLPSPDTQDSNSSFAIPSSPLQIYCSQQEHLSRESSKNVNIALLELLGACVDASLRSSGGIKESEKAYYWEEARRWAEEGKVEVEERDEKRWILPDEDREGLVIVLDSLTKGGRDLSDVPGLVSLLSTFVTDSLPYTPPPSPLFDPTVTTPFIRTSPLIPAPHSSSLALLTALHKFSAPHIYTASTLLAIRAALEIARLPEERYISEGVLDFLGAVVRFGEVTGRKGKQAKQVGGSAEKSNDVTEGDEILREVVSVVARMIGCEGLVGVIEVHVDRPLPKVHDQRILPSTIPPLALQLMRDLLRSPANQALKSLRNTLVAPPSPSSTISPPPTPILLLVGVLRSLRKSLMEHSAEAEASLDRGESSALLSGESRWPTMLSLGLPFLWGGLNRVMLWQSGRVDAEVLRLVEERLEVSERAAIGAAAREAAASGMSNDGVDVAGRVRVKEIEDRDGGVTFEEWDMAIEILGKARWHITAWEALKKRPWVMQDDAEEEDSSDEEGKVPRFAKRTDILAAFSSLLQKILQAWLAPGFLGPSERVFTLLVSLAPHLSEQQALSVLEQCDRNNFCLPVYPEWLERLQEVLKSFYVISSTNAFSSRYLRRGPSTNTRRRALQLLSQIHSHFQSLDSELRSVLVRDVILPLFESNFEIEVDLEVAEVLLTILVNTVEDSILLGEDGVSKDSVQGFDRLRTLLLRVARGAVKPADRISSTAPPSTPRADLSRRGAGLSSLSRYHQDSSPTTMRSSPSISAPSLPANGINSSPRTKDVSVLAIVALTSIFHTCLATSTRTSSEKAIVIFRDLLAIAAPSLQSPLDPSLESVSDKTRFAVLQWLVRLRADASQKIHWVEEVDIQASAKILGRADAFPTGLNEVPNLDDSGKPDDRGRAARGEAPQRSGREMSGSRVRMRSEDRSPSRGGGSRGRVVSKAASSVLWIVPEVIPFNFGKSLAAVGVDGLVSFDHNRMREWTEEEDPGTGLFKVSVVEEVVPLGEALLVLPISEYLRTIHHLLQVETEWELVSYILCHLPEQLSNKHFACGPRASQQLHRLRTLLCDGLRGGDRPFSIDVNLPPTVKRPEVHAIAYSLLTSLIAYRSLFNKTQQDEMVITFMYGLGNPRDTAKVCIHALGMATFELRPSVTKHLAEIVRHLQKIISSATLGVHILELIAAVGQEPSLYANFTEIDFQTVFGIALKYIQAHNERLADNPLQAQSEEGLDYAFSQYVFLLAYYSIAQWYLALRLSERPKYVPFLTRRLVLANEGKAEIDEPTEVCFDMIARYAFTNADPRPRSSTFDSIITTGQSSTPPKSWIIGNAVITVKATPAPAWVEVTIRRASGVVRMLWELQNISGVASNSDGDLIAMHLRHRETSRITSKIPSVVSEALATLTDHHQQAHLGFRARAHSFSGPPTSYPTIQENTVSDAINSAATVAAQPSLESGLLSVDPSFFALQLSSFPEFEGSGPPLRIPNDSQYQRGISTLDRLPIVDFHKIGVLYAGPGQITESEILSNTHGSKPYVDLISSLGKLVRLKGSREYDIYAGGLDQETDIDGKWTYVWDDDISQIVFHIATLMPTTPSTDPQATLKKRHIGNDYVKIVFNDSGEDFAFDTLPGDFNFVNIIIQPHTPDGNAWIGPGMTSNTQFFKVTMQRRAGMPEIGPNSQIITAPSLPSLVRTLSLHSNIFVQIYLATIGFEARQGNQKVEYSSNWRRRLQQIKLLKGRILEATGKKEEVLVGLDLDQAEVSRLFTTWV